MEARSAMVETGCAPARFPRSNERAARPEGASGGSDEGECRRASVDQGPPCWFMASCGES